MIGRPGGPGSCIAAGVMGLARRRLEDGPIGSTWAATAFFFREKGSERMNKHEHSSAALGDAHGQAARHGTARHNYLMFAINMGLSLVAILFTGFPDLTVNTWRFILLGVMTIGNVVTVILLIQRSRRLKLNRLAFLFLVNIVIVFILSGLARIPDQTIPLQWMEQLLNTFAQGAFAYAAWKLAQAVDKETASRQEVS